MASSTKKKRGTQTTKKIPASGDIPPNIQKTLWNSSPHSSEHFPGKLSLCLGMPVMIRNNDATELCITKGQEAFVVGWHSIQGPHNQNVLETLFLKLKNPPKSIQLPHLPENVIPMSKTSKSIKCTLPNDYEINIVRQQVNILPNFSMTDYASQGKTRLYNVINLSHCKNFQSIYTCLSCGSSAAGTIIVQGFNSTKITRGLSGHLRQEFRELNLLNNITLKIFEGHISTSYLGTLRNPMIYKYQNNFPIQKETTGWHHTLKDTTNEIFITKCETDGTWNLSSYDKLLNIITNVKNKKQKTKSLEDTEYTTFNKHTQNSYTPNNNNLQTQSPKGLIWDSVNYSYAYDSLFTVLYHLWTDGQINHKTYFKNGTQYLQLLHSYFELLSTNLCSFETIRNELRQVLHNKKPLEYRFGKIYTDLNELIRDFTTRESYGTSTLQCLNCHFTVQKPYSYLQDYTSVGWSASDFQNLHTTTIQQYCNLKIYKHQEQTNKFCPNCLRHNKIKCPIYTTQHIHKLPTILIFAIAPWVNIDDSLIFNVSGSYKKYTLKGIIYTNGNHFTARLIDNNSIIWYHDGQSTRSLCQKDQPLIQLKNLDKLKTYNKQYKAIIAFYAEC